MSCDVNATPVQQERHRQWGHTQSRVHQLGMARRCPGCTPVYPGRWSCSWLPVAAEKCLYRSCHHLHQGQAGRHSQQHEKGAKDSVNTKLMPRNSNFAHHVSCKIACSDKQRQGNTLGSSDAADMACPPEKPGRQVQVKPPCVLTQLALVAQPAVCRTHSLMSMLQLGPSYLQAKCAADKVYAATSVPSVTP